MGGWGDPVADRDPPAKAKSETDPADIAIEADEISSIVSESS